MPEVLFEFDLAVPCHRHKSRIIRDDDGYLTTQSICDETKAAPHVWPDGWKDEFRKGEDWPRPIGIVYENQSSVIKAAIEYGKKIAKIEMQKSLVDKIMKILRSDPVYTATVCPFSSGKIIIYEDKFKTMLEEELNNKHYN